MTFNANSPVADCEKVWKRRTNSKKSTYTRVSGITLASRCSYWGSSLGTRHNAPFDIQDSFLKSVVLTEHNFKTPQPIMSKLLTNIGYVSKTGKPLSAGLVQKFERELGLSRTDAYKKFFYNTNHIDAVKLKKQNLYRYVVKLNCQALLDPEGPIIQNNANTIKPDLNVHEWQAIAGHGVEYVGIIRVIIDKLWNKMNLLASGTW